MRGKANSIMRVDKSLRITPACAGKRGRPQQRNSNNQDHPRVCGEKPYTCDANDKAVGSPPRVRGKGKVSSAFGSAFGITPACAGKSFQGSTVRFAGWDHPRVCGEKKNASLFFVKLTGSPPRVRGKGSRKPERELDAGITPACAGKSSPVLIIIPGTWDHPRVCGEKLSFVFKSSAKSGSPPRVRGKGGSQSGTNVQQGITPACAGKST